MGILSSGGRVLASAGRGFNRFLELKNEDEGTKKITFFAVIILTFGLAFLSISGAFAKSSGDGGAWIPRVAYAVVVFGLELLAAVLFTRAMRAQDKFRMMVCLAVLPFLTWANVQNAKDGLRFIMPEVFGHSSVVLNERANLAAEEAGTLGQAQQAAIASTGGELERVRTQIAELKTEQQVMASMSPEGIGKAQSLLLAQGLYFGSVDGIRQDKTESAMRARGEAIQGELATLKAREDGLMAGQASPVQQATTNKRLEEIEMRAAAAEAADAELRADIIFWVAEFARNLLLWAAVTGVTASGIATLRRREDELAELAHQRERGRIIAEMNATAAPPAAPVEATPAPEPVASEAPITPEPAPIPEPEPMVLDTPAPPVEPELTPAQQRGRAGGLATAQARKANRAKTERLILVPSFVARDAEAEAAKVAAE